MKMQLGQLLRLAWRNLRRSRTRTAISATTISLSFCLMLFNFSLKDASYQQMLRAAVKVAGGSVLVHAEGWQDSHAANLVITDPGRVMEAARRIPEVRAVIPRMIIDGLLSSARGAEPVRLAGVDRQAQSALSDVARFLAEGTYLDPREEQPLVLGPKLARKLVVKLGDRVVLTATDRQGEMARALFHVSGILQPRSGLEEVAFTSLAAAAAVVGADGACNEIGILLADDTRRGEAASALRAALSLPGTQRFEVLTWEQVLPELLGTIRSDKSLTYLLVLVIFVIVGFGIANTLLTSVLERVRDLGLLSALGLTPARTAGLVLAESGLLAIFSLALGYVIMLGVHHAFTRRGIELAAVSGMKMEWGGVILDDVRLRTAIDPARWILGGTGVALIVVASALYPAWKATRLDPAQAMRTYE
jgi:ABC-type lipoprotein release transport system permease subunit